MELARSPRGLAWLCAHHLGVSAHTGAYFLAFSNHGTTANKAAGHLSWSVCTYSASLRDTMPAGGGHAYERHGSWQVKVKGMAPTAYVRPCVPFGALSTSLICRRGLMRGTLRATELGQVGSCTPHQPNLTCQGCRRHRPLRSPTQGSSHWLQAQLRAPLIG